MKKVALLCGVALVSLALVGLPAVAHAAKGKKATVKIVNKSDWEIHHLFLSSTEEEEWGPDQLGDEVVETGDSFTLNQIPCDSYDVKLIDEDDDECVVEDVDLCGGAESWVITNKILLGCQSSTE